ncbi:hypothetical protein FRAHR75_1310013 [Frankia sp. Hr75.2]|nr:hypothetical protein FRAHR75_1310013 [Frankia sp. Hr75.2]
MGHRDPTRQERDLLREQVLDLAWTWARTLADLADEDKPWSVYDGAQEQQRTSTAARARALELLAAVATEAARDDASFAGETLSAAGPAPAWTREDVLAYLTEAGAPVGADTWSGYVSRGQAPAPTRRIGRTPVWDPAQVRTWQAARRGRGWRAGSPPEQQTGDSDADGT